MLQQTGLLFKCIVPPLACASLSGASLELQHRWASNAAAGTKASKQPAAAPAATPDASPVDKPPSILCASTSTKLQAADVGSFYKLQANLLREALRPEGAAVEAGSLRRSCPGLEDEVAASRNTAVMHRQCMEDLRAFVQNPGCKLLLRGPTGAGKSVALAALVEWARSSGWVVMYVPSASAMTRGGYFVPRPGTEQYDTIQSAQYVLRSLVQAHGKQLSQIPSSSSAAASGSASAGVGSSAAAHVIKTLGKGSLLDVANEGLQTDSDAILAVDACLAVKDGLLAASATAGSTPRVLLAVDDYNMLHWRTEYGRTTEEGARQLLVPDDLTLASRMRLLANEPSSTNAVVVAAVSGSRGVPESIEPATTPDTIHYHVPRYSLVEAAHALYWYWECGLAPTKPTKRNVELLHSLANGNAKEIRQLAPKLTLLASGLL